MISMQWFWTFKNIFKKNDVNTAIYWHGGTSKSTSQMTHRFLVTDTAFNKKPWHLSTNSYLWLWFLWLRAGGSPQAGLCSVTRLLASSAAEAWSSVSSAPVLTSPPRRMPTSTCPIIMQFIFNPLLQSTRRHLLFKFNCLAQSTLPT